MDTSQPMYLKSPGERARMELEHRKEERRLAELKIKINKKLKAAGISADAKASS